MPNSLRVAVVTPYYRETPEILRHCHDSVRTQTYTCDHFLVADGFPQSEARNWTAQHLVLARSHSDNGNTPRAIGSLSAMNQGYDAIAFLDADNWYYPNHIETMVNLQRESGAAVCTAARTIHRLDGSLMYVDHHDSDGDGHVDTSCMFFAKPAFRLLPVWAMMPRQLGPICDTIMWQAIGARGLKTAHSRNPTVAFRTQYQVHYQNIGEKPPTGAKSNEESTGQAHQWWRSLPQDVRSEWSNSWLK
jgi:glycosyltransferase involved in cell wall biosynthesis